ncbi:MAG: ATP-dependent DNA helicase RecG [Spirochaetaceae bacterium]|nr:ATP-dependent DNA helicase RecG [Spirochaetaceae bacterium]
MFLHELKQPVSVLRGGGPAVSGRLARLGISSIAGLLSYYPRDYDDRSTLVPFSGFARNAFVYTQGVVTAHEWFGFGRNRTLKILVRDDTSEAALLCFNRPFLENSIPVGSRVQVHGKFQFRYGEIQSSAFEIEQIAEGHIPFQGLLPLYPLTEGLSQAVLRKLMKAALTMYGNRVENELDPEIMKDRKLLPKATALSLIHFPGSMTEKDEALRTLSYEELFYFQLGIAMRIRKRRGQEIERKPTKGILEKQLLERLPFSLTTDQRRALDEIVHDLNSPHPMARLLQGDVGSGKTIVALIAALHTVERGGQVAIMAPTELLAQQHAATAARLIEPLGLRLAFLSGNVDDAPRRPLLEALANGSIDIVIGTHALFSSDVIYRDLQMIVVDEQQRFGVAQRQALFHKGNIPDMLMMTATPIPRSLALTLFGDLTVSTIRTMPPGRKPVQTHLTKAGNEQKVYDFVRGLLKAGQQAYFVYPLIGESDNGELKNAKQMAERLAKEVYPGFSVNLLHSRLKEDQKRSIMDDFVRGKTQVLVATTVVEVGVDVPNATVMVIEHAERFGLSALHQLRGRIGRGTSQSYCFLVYSENITADAIQRLRILYSTNDGFALAEEDLKLRGPGELLGTAQSGPFQLRVANPLRDFELLKAARSDAFAIVKDDPGFISVEHAIYRQTTDMVSGKEDGYPA